MPELWLVSRVCEEFGVTPPEAVGLLENDNDGLVLGVMRMRSFKGAMDLIESYEAGHIKLEDFPVNDRMVQQVYEIQFGLVRRELGMGEEGGDGD